MTGRQPSKIGLFWRSLVEDGQVVILDDEAPPADDMAGLHSLLTDLDRDSRLRLAYTPPPMDTAAAEWACLILYRACQFLVLREVKAEVVQQELSRPCPGTKSASVIYSADLALQHLSEVLVLASGIAPQDPLTIMLGRLTEQWPLSSVGIKGAGNSQPVANDLDLDIILANPCLSSLYVDRVIAHNDISRLDDSRIAHLARAALGAFPQLNPNISQHLAKETEK